MKKMLFLLLAVMMLFFSTGCADLSAGVTVVPKRDKSLLSSTPEINTGGGSDQFTVLYIPLDNRPINYDNVFSLAAIAGVQLLTPSPDIIGSPGENGGQDGPGDPGAIMQWLADNANRADAWVISLDMLLYGGLAPSRSHDRGQQEITREMQRLQQLLAKNNKDFPVYAFATVMRSAASSASPKQPGYFSNYGDYILSLSKLWDLADRQEASSKQLAELERLKSEIPMEVLNNYLQRRQTNLNALRRAVHLTAGGLVDYLVLGRDDTTPYSFSRMDLRRLESDVGQRGLFGRVDSYPGADELGALLLARAINDNCNRQPKVYVDWATPQGPGITALYEDVTLGENVRLHVKSAGGRVVDNLAEADLVLAVNNPANKTVEASLQPVDLLPGQRHRTLAKRIYTLLAQGKPVAVADVAYANGGDRLLMETLAEYPTKAGSITSQANGGEQRETTASFAGSALLFRLAGYAGCNTAGNSIGMALAHGLVYSENAEAKGSVINPVVENAHFKYLLARILEDWGFQAMIRPGIIKAGHYGALSAGTPLNKTLTMQLEDEITKQLNSFLTNTGPTSENKTRVTGVTLPWNRLFDINFILES